MEIPTRNTELPMIEDKRRVLIVDDDPIIRDVLSSIISTLANFDTDTAADGMDGLDKIKTGPYDIVFTDIKMPRLGGLEFIREAKKLRPQVPIVAITSYNYVETAISAMKGGAADFVTKPFKAADIKFILNRIQNESNLLGKLNPSGGANNGIYEKLREISLMHTIFSELDEINDNRELFERCVELAAKLMKANEISLGLIEDNCLNIIRALGTIERKIGIGPSLADFVEKKTLRVVDIGSPSPITMSNPVSQMIVLPLILKQEVFGIFTIGRKSNGYNFTEEEINLALTFTRKLSTRIENNALYDIFYNNLLKTLKALVMTIEARDSYTKHHSERVTMISVEIAKALGCSAEEINVITFGGYLHDIGKIGVRDTVLLKPSLLTEKEFEEIRLHPVIGDNIIKPLGSFPNERLIIRNHHERFDGEGYPDSLAGEDIPKSARIVSIADTYDSMTSTRPYRNALTHDAAISEIRKGAGTQFDPVFVEAFMETCFGRGEKQDAA